MNDAILILIYGLMIVGIVLWPIVFRKRFGKPIRRSIIYGIGIVLCGSMFIADSLFKLHVGFLISALSILHLLIPGVLLVFKANQSIESNIKDEQNT